MTTTSSSSLSNEYSKAQKEIVEEHQLQEKITNEEFKIWKKTVPLLYDIIHTYSFENPSLIFQWIPGYTTDSSNQHINIKCLYGTNSLDKNQNYLKIGSINLPSTLSPTYQGSSGLAVPNVDDINEDSGDFKTLATWKQSSEINKLKVSPNGQFAIGFNADGIIRGYNLSNNDIIDYKYHKQEGYALEWFPNNTSFLSGATDSQIALWNIDKPSTPIQLFKSHRGAINDLSSIPGQPQPSLFGSVSDDSTTQFHDIRIATTTQGINPAITVENSHIQNCISFHPDIDTLYATGGKDNVVSLYDIRNYKTPFRKFFGHNGTITNLKWDIHNPKYLISTALDKRLIVWDLNHLDHDFTYPGADNIDSSSKRKTQQQQQQPQVDPCLRFVHGGHTQRIGDFDVHPDIKNLFGTVGDDNLLEVWKPKTLPVEEEEEEEEDEEHEAERPQEEDSTKNDEETKNENDDTEMKDVDTSKEDLDEESKPSKDVEMKD